MMVNNISTESEKMYKYCVTLSLREQKLIEQLNAKKDD